MSKRRSILQILHSPMKADFWDKPPARQELIGLGLVLLLMSLMMARYGWVPLLDWATLTIHEAGHPIIGMLFGQNLMVYGGSLFQILFPLIFVWHFVRQRQPAGFCFSLAWEASALHALGRYVADARAQELPLVGNGDRIHDWHEILSRWNLLAQDQLLGNVLYGLCWLLMGCCFYMLWNWWSVK